MHKEHEELMRSDFHDRFTETLRALQPDVTEAQRQEIARRIGEYDSRWQSGPHAEHWWFLHAAYRDWRDHPEQMQRFAQDIEAHRDIWENNGLRDVGRRSVDQARNIANEERAVIGALHQRSHTQRGR